MNKKTTLLLTLFSCLPLLFSCNKEGVDGVEGYAIKYRSRPELFLPADFTKQPNIVIMGDGFTVSDFGAFEAAAKKVIDNLFSVSPFNADPFDKYFNVFFVYLNSPERGIGHGKAKNTALRCYFYSGTEIFFDDVNSTGGRKALNPFEVAEYYVPGINLSTTVVVVLVNDNQTGYITSFRNVAPFDQWISIISIPDNPDDFKRLVLKEVGGKGFAHLGDEDGPYSSEFKIMIKNMYATYGFYANLDITAKEDEVRWKHFLPYKSTIYKNIGIFDIGSGVYRPDENNVMMRYGTLQYDPPSREAIIKRIYTIHAWDYTRAVFNYYFVDNPI